MRRFIAISAVFTLVWAAFAPGPARAATVCDLLLKSVRQNRFYGTCGRCHVNSLSLIEYARTRVPGFDLQKARVLFIHHRRLQLAPQVVRIEDQTWSYHVVVEYEGQVIDRDFFIPPYTLPLNAYLERMFRVDRWFNPDITVIPAADYARDFGFVDGEGRIRDGKFYLDQAESEEPVYPSVGALEIVGGAGLPAVRPAPLRGPWRTGPRIELNRFRKHILWQEGPNIYQLDGPTGVIATVAGPDLFPAPGKLNAFIRAVQAAAIRSREVREVWRMYLENGGARAGDF